MSPVVRRVLIVLAGAAALVVVFLLVRGGDDAGDTTAQTTTEAPTPAPTETGTTGTQPTPTATPRPRPSRVVVRIPIRGGRVAGGVKRVSLDKGERVLIAVSSDDISDHVHVHGYDLFRDVGPGAPARIAFRATLVGRFEVELEERSLPIAELTVRP